MHRLGLARFELPTGAKGEKREGFFYSLPGCEVEGKEGEVMLESCQQTSEIPSLFITINLLYEIPRSNRDVVCITLYERIACESSSLGDRTEINNSVHLRLLTRIL